MSLDAEGDARCSLSRLTRRSPGGSANVAIAREQRYRRRSCAAVNRGIAAVLAVLGLAVSCARAPGEPRGTGGGLRAAIAEVEAGRRTTPLIASVESGEASVTFLAKGLDGQIPRVVSDVTGWGEDTTDDTFDLTAGTMTRVGSTDWYRLETKVAVAARIQYLIVQGQTDYRTDPHNPRLASFPGIDPVSEFVTPGYAPPPEFAGPPAAPAGKTAEATLESLALRGSRRAIVYTPPGYRPDGAYPVAVFHSGLGVAREGEASRVLDWLIAHGEIVPLVAVFAESHLPGDTQNHEGDAMRTFLNQEVPAWLAARCSVATRVDGWAILAVSYGAKDALDAALAPDGAYGRLGLLIPGRRLRPADIEALVGRGQHRVRVAILAGRYDAANIATARDARQALAAAGHVVDYLEVSEGHNPTTWRNHLRDVLISLFGRSGAAPPEAWRVRRAGSIPGAAGAAHVAAVLRPLGD